MCNVFGVGRSSYYRWLRSGVAKRTVYRRYVQMKIKHIHRESRQTYGSPRITAELKDQGINVSRPTVAKLMKQNNIKSLSKKRFRATTDSAHCYGLFRNVLNRDFTADAPSEVWVSDMTYVSTKKGWLYVTVILDLYDRKVIGWSMSQSLATQQTTVPALLMAMKNRSSSPGLIFHSDRGIQYAATEFTRLTSRFRIRQSMSRKGDCWDNAVAESFFKSLKTECVYRREFADTNVARREIFAYIEYWYNRMRRHSALGYRTPLQTEEDFIRRNRKIVP